MYIIYLNLKIFSQCLICFRSTATYLFNLVLVFRKGTLFFKCLIHYSLRKLKKSVDLQYYLLNYPHRQQLLATHACDWGSEGVSQRQMVLEFFVATCKPVLSFSLHIPVLHAHRFIFSQQRFLRHNKDSLAGLSLDTVFIQLCNSKGGVICYG